MLSKPRCPIIALEEHYWDEELALHFTGIEAVRDGEAFERLKDSGAWRLKEMDDEPSSCCCWFRDGDLD